MLQAGRLWGSRPSEEVIAFSHFTKSFRPHKALGVYSASNRNEYQEQKIKILESRV
jgi:hypothetical protein